MKPKKLVMSAFGPYAETAEVDFDKINSGIFLITGETGSGKTTVFDGISYALFDRTSGDNRKGDSMRSDYAPLDADTYVRLEFEHKGETYTIERSPNYVRAKKRGEGTTPHNADATLYMADGKIVTGIKNVNEKVRELLGVDYAQFKQIAMIAQGEFLNLLLADSTNRSEIFRKVFGTDIYKQFQESFAEKLKTVNEKRQNISAEIKRYTEDIHTELNSEYSIDLSDLKENTYKETEILDLLTKIINENESKKKTIGENLKETESKLEETAKKIETANTINDMFADLEKKQSEYKILSDRHGEIEEIHKNTECGKKALREVKPLYTEYKNAENQYNDLKNTIAANEKIIAENTENEKQYKAELDELIGREKEREDISVKIKNIADSLPKYETIDKKNKEKAVIENNITELKNSLNTLETECKAEKERLDEIDEFIRSAEKLKVEKQVCDGKISDLRNDYKKYKSLQDAAAKLNDIKKDYTYKCDIFKGENENFENQSKIYTEYESAFYANQAGILAEKLADNEPCPVCGSLTHPNPSKAEKESVSESELNVQKEKLEKARAKMQSASIECNVLNEKLKIQSETVSQSAEELGIESVESFDFKSKLNEITAEGKSLGAQSDSMARTIQNAEKLEEEKEKTEKLISAQEKEKEEKTKDLNLSEQNLAGLSTEIATLSKQLEYHDKESAQRQAQSLQSTLQKMKDELASAQRAYDKVREIILSAKSIIAENKGRCGNAEKNAESTRQVYADILSKCGFENEEDYKAALISEEQIKVNENQINQYNIDTETLKSLIKQLEGQLGGKEKTDTSELTKTLSELQSEKKNIQSKLTETEIICHGNRNVYGKLAGAQEERKKIEQEYSDIKMLSDTARGQLTGKERISFEQYVQGVYFNMVLGEANKRFRKMTSNQYSMIHSKPKIQNGSTGLMIDVECLWSNKIRSVSTLSGGESFKAALSLALGLSDVVQRFSGGVELNAMFVDEGFGSLDGESLESALEVLAELSAGNRLIGIISHVDELKEKIDRKIVITKTRRGSSLKMEC